MLDALNHHATVRHMSGSVPFTCALLAMHHISARHSPVHRAPYIIYMHRSPTHRTLVHHTPTTSHLYIAHLCAGARLHRVGPCICRAPHLCTWPQFAPIYLASLTLPRAIRSPVHHTPIHRTPVRRASPTSCEPMHLSGTVSLHKASVRADLPDITHTAPGYPVICAPHTDTSHTYA